MVEPRAAVLKAGFDVAHMVLSSVIGDLDEDDGAFAFVEGTVPPVRAILAHLLVGEDMVVNQMVRGREMVLASGGFGAEAGIVEPLPMMTPEWVATHFNMDGLRAYADGVIAETTAFLEHATAAELDRMVGTPLGTEMTAAEVIVGLALVHVSVHAGELAAIKGAIGKQGLPF